MDANIFDVKVGKFFSYLFIENKIEFIELDEFCRGSGYSIKTVYDWKYRKRKYKTPNDLFAKFNAKVFLRVAVLKRWFLIQNPTLVGLERS